MNSFWIFCWDFPHFPYFVLPYHAMYMHAKFQVPGFKIKEVYFIAVSIFPVYINWDLYPYVCFFCVPSYNIILVCGTCKLYILHPFFLFFVFEANGLCFIYRKTPSFVQCNGYHTVRTKTDVQPFWSRKTRLYRFILHADRNLTYNATVESLYTRFVYKI